LLAIAAVTTLAACSSTPAGSKGFDAFMSQAEPSLSSSPREVMQVAQCFEDRATFLPLSAFARDPSTNTFTYRLRISDLWFEEVRIAPEGEGSRAEWRVAPNLDDKWLSRFERDRIAPLRRCLGA
jgi:hypothetical protein